MPPVTWTVSGLAFDIVGALLVAVEAVKLRNLRALRERFFVPLRRALLPTPIQWIDGEMYVPKRTDWFGRIVLSPFLAWFVFHALLAAVPVVLLDLVLRQFNLHVVSDIARAYADFFGSASRWLQAVLAFGTLWAGLLFVALAGEPAHQALIRVAAFPIAVLDFVDRKTPDGTVGIIGALFLIVGFSLQVVGAVASSHH